MSSLWGNKMRKYAKPFFGDTLTWKCRHIGFMMQVVIGIFKK